MDVQPDLGEEIIEKLKEINLALERKNKELIELREYKQKMEVTSL